MTALLIKITPEVLERAKMCGTKECKRAVVKSCAIAEAIQNIFPKSNTSAHYIRVYLDDSADSIMIDLPKIATDFILLFDKTTPHLRPLMTPFSFTVELPDEVVERIDISDVEKSLTLELV